MFKPKHLNMIPEAVNQHTCPALTSGYHEKSSNFERTNRDILRYITCNKDRPSRKLSFTSSNIISVFNYLSAPLSGLHSEPD